MFGLRLENIYLCFVTQSCYSFILIFYMHMELFGLFHKCIVSFEDLEISDKFVRMLLQVFRTPLEGADGSYHGVEEGCRQRR